MDMFASVIDVILPALNEARALPIVIPTLPDGFRAIVVDNGSTDGTAEVARDLGAVSRVRTETRIRRRVLRRSAGSRPLTSCVSWTATRRSTVEICRRSPRQYSPVDAELVLGARQPDSSAAWPFHARLANRVLARVGPATDRTRRSPTSGRCGRRDEMRSSSSRFSDRRFGWPLEMVLRAAAAGWTVTRSSRRLPPKGRSLEGHRHGARHRARGARHGAGARDDHRHGLGEGTGRGPGEDPALPAVHARGRGPHRRGRPV